MSDQIEIDYTTIVYADSIQTKFLHFHARNPAVYSGLVSLAREAKMRGRSKVGMKQLFEVLRWQWMISGLPDEHEHYKLNNNYTSRYARLIMEQEPTLDGIFETRVLTA